MIKNRFLLYLLCGVMVSPAAALGECKPTQDCRALGYKEAPCPEQGVKCPFGETWYCPLRCKDGQVWKDGKCTDILGGCSGAAKNCKIGQILNSDASCTGDKVSGKTPIGVVVYISPEGCGQALALKDLGIGAWAPGYQDIPELPNYSKEEAKNDFDSCGNTKKINDLFLNQNPYNQSMAAQKSFEYSPAAAPQSKGKWCVPAAGVAQVMIDNRYIINEALSKAGGSILQGDKTEYEYEIWTSTEGEEKSRAVYAYFFYSGTTYYGNLTDNDKGGNGRTFIRPVIEF